MENVVYYSERCPTSINLLRTLRMNNLSNFFKFVCIDSMLKRLPPCIQTVPTMLVNGEQRPLVAKEAFEWIEKVKFMNQSANRALNCPFKQNDESNIISYREQEHNSISDPYAYMKTDKSMTQKYVDTEMNNGAIFTGVEHGKMKTKDTVSEINKLKKERDQFNKDAKEYMENQQLLQVMQKREQEREQMGY